MMRNVSVLDILHELTHAPAAGSTGPGNNARAQYRRKFSTDELEILRLLIDHGEMDLEDMPSVIGTACLSELKLIEPVRRSRRGPSGEAIIKTHLTLTRRGVIIAQFLNPRE